MGDEHVVIPEQEVRLETLRHRRERADRGVDPARPICSRQIDPPLTGLMARSMKAPRR